MSESIVIDPNEIKTYVDEIRQLADANKDALGFLPASVYSESAMKGGLWVAVDRIRKVRGYLLFGGRFPRLRIFQIFVRSEYRGSGIARTLLEKLRDYGEQLNYLTITARVARELEANRFWEACGFLVTDRIPGKARGRPLNKYTLELNVPSLFRGESLRAIDSTQIRFPAEVGVDVDAHRALRAIDSTQIRFSGPILSTPSYVIDLNVFFDVLRNRDKEESSIVLSLGLNGDVCLFVTSEFVKELERHTADRQRDPVLDLARNLSTLPDVDPDTAKPLIEDLRTLLWSGIPKTGRRAVNDASDLSHLASCIHHKVDGFITRDEAILRHAADLRRVHDLNIVSPTYFIDLFDGDFPRPESALASVDRQDIEITDLDERNRKDVEKFLRGLDVDPDQVRSCLAPGSTRHPRPRRIVRFGSRLVGMGSWKNPGPGRVTDLHLYVDEKQPNSERAIDRLFLESMHGGVDRHLLRLDLHTSRSQEKTREVAVHAGFRPPKHEGGSSGALAKVSFRGVVGADNWPSFRRDFKAKTDCELLQEDVPSWRTISDTGIVMDTGQRGRPVTISSFDFETLVSPCALILPDRTAVIIPIKKKYTGLISSTGRQRSLLPEKETAFRLERAYFLAAGKHGLLPMGTIVVFYVSSPQREAVALARVTFSDTLTKAQAVTKLGRQGVLSEKDIARKADRCGKITAFTFDNLLKFQTNVSYQDLKRDGCVSGANLVTAQRLTHRDLRRIVNRAFGVKF